LIKRNIDEIIFGLYLLRKLHNEELCDLYSSPQYFSGDKIEKNEMGEACSAYGEGSPIPGFGGET
jgi:hypothetical protein